MPRVMRKSRLLTREEMELVNTRSMDADVLVRAQGASEESLTERPAPDAQTLLQKAAGGPATEAVRLGRFRHR